jgi:DNA-binding FadR family transcriptional regulator
LVELSFIWLTAGHIGCNHCAGVFIFGAQPAGASSSSKSIKQMADDLTLLDQVKTWLTSSPRGEDGRIPPERELAEQFGVKRAQLRKALGILQSEGFVRRHVGRGTYFAEPSTVLPTADKLEIYTSPYESMQVRLILEPEIAKLAAHKATGVQIAELRNLNLKMRAAQNWTVYDELDCKFHSVLAEATGNRLLSEMQSLVNAVRRTVIWGYLIKRSPKPTPDYHSFAEHDAIAEAVARRDRDSAASAMRKHLSVIASKLFKEL